MLKSYFKIAIRNLKRQLFFSVLNVTGLAVGIACAILIVLFIADELSYDRYHSKADRIYRVNVSAKFGGKDIEGTWHPAPFARTLMEEFPEVESATRIRFIGNFMIRYGDKNLKEERFVYTDTETFEIFSFPFIKGDPKTCLDEPYTLVMTETLAKKYFGDEDPIGKIVIVDNETEYMVTGIIEEIPKNSHFHFDIFASLESMEDSRNQIWLNQNYPTYLSLVEGTKPEDLEAKFPPLLEKYFGPQLIQYMGFSIEDFFNQGNKYNLYLQPITDIHLYSDIGGELGVNSDIKYIYIFASIGIFILIIACINFMNLSTARSSGRAKEVGIRKVLGSFRKQLINQFLTEAMIISTIALILALVIMSLTLPFVNNLALKDLEMTTITSVPMLSAIIIITILIGLLAGSYPAFFISSFKPVDVLKSKLMVGSKSSFLRSVLVVLQFTTSIILIVGAFVVYEQLQFIQNKKLGFDRENVIIIEDTWLMEQQVFSFKEVLKQHPDIKSVSVSGYLPTPSDRTNNMMFKKGEVMTEKTTTVSTWRVDVDYVKTMGMEILQGRDFSDEFASDSAAIIINEAVVKQFELGENPVGMLLGDYSGSNNSAVYYNIIGVVTDFHFESLRQDIDPAVLRLQPDWSKTSVRISSNNIPALLDFIEEKWDEFAPGNPFDYSFMDSDFDKVYKAEMRLGQIFSVFAMLAIFIGCLGLFGLAAFTSEQRTKEIGIRKTLGASVNGIVFLLSREFGKLVLISFIVSAPIAYYVMNIWLADFAYRINLTLSIFIFAGFIAFLIALLTVSYQAIKAALANPVDSLRNE
ncbi:MAG: ABC transporter permease [Ignavibacteria bacterium]|jgi:putative ABC transport system permease protein